MIQINEVTCKGPQMKKKKKMFFEWTTSFFQRFDNHEKIVCKMGQTGHAKFIRLLVGQFSTATKMQIMRPQIMFKFFGLKQRINNAYNKLISSEL